MKHLYTLLLFAVLLLQFPSRAQDCTYSEALGEFQANFVRTYFNPAGDKFWDRERAGFQVPDKGKNTPSTLFSGNVWIAAHDENADLHVSANAFYQPFRNDFAPGPLVQTSQGDTSIFDPLYCGLFDRVWRVDRKEILDHILDFQEDGVIDQRRPNIYGWPAEGNTAFEEIHGFALPMHNGGWAPFSDQNENGIYEPDLGEYPHILLEGNAHIPDQILWLVFNDIGGAKNSSHGIPLNIEIQLTAYAFFCSENPLLNHSVFNSYKIINQSSYTYSDVYFGQWMDPDVGCFSDDFIGSDPQRNTVFAYNEDPLDGNVGILCNGGVLSYGASPPVQAMTFISQPLTYSGYYLNPALMSNHPATTDPQTDIEYYYYLTGRWRDGTPWTSEGLGYNPGSTDSVTHMFPGNPNTPGEWSLYDIAAPDGDRRTISSAHFDALPSLGQISMDLVYSFHSNPDSNNIETINLMYQQIDSLLEWVTSPNLSCSQINEYCTSDCVWPGDFNADGIIDHFDFLNLGLANNTAGAARNGLVTWMGHSADNWDKDFIDGTNMKHADANGDGLVDLDDLLLHDRYFLNRLDTHAPMSHFPIGDEILLDLKTPDATLISGGTVRFDIISQIDLNNIHGLAFTLHYDSSLFRLIQLAGSNPFEQENVIQFPNPSQGNRYAITLDDQSAGFIPQNQRIAIGFMTQKNEIPIEDLPEFTSIHLENLIGIDANGDTLDIGYAPLIIYKEITSSVEDVNLEDLHVSIFPNPADGYLRIQQEEVYFRAIRLYQTDGRLIDEIKLSNTKQNSIDISSYESGLYILELVNDAYRVHQRVLFTN